MNNFIDVCKLLGNYNDKDVYLYTSSKFKSNSIFYSPDYFLLPKWADPEKLTLMQAVKIINFRMKNKNNDSDNLKPEDLKIDATIESVKNQIKIK